MFNILNIKDPKTQRNLLILVLLIMLFIGGCGYTAYKSSQNELSIANQNTVALSDELRISKNKNKDLEYSKGVLIAEKNDLKNLNKKLDADLKNEKGKVHEINRIIATITQKDTIKIKNDVKVYPNGVYGLKWKYNKQFDSINSRTIAGESKFKFNNDSINDLGTEITADQIKFKLVTGLREKDGKVEIFATSNYPGLEVVELDGAIIDPKSHPVLKKFTKKTRWGVGPYVGFGVSNGLTPSVQIGLGVQYSLFKF